MAAALLFGAVIVAIAPACVGRRQLVGGPAPSNCREFQPLARPSPTCTTPTATSSPSFQRQNSQPIALAEIPEQVADAFLAVEDREFYTHNGVNARSLVRAALSNVASDVAQQGASTITMQVAKNEFLGGIDRDFRYKVLQIHYAMMLENEYTKDEILERYLNTVFFGNNAYGVEAAAETYFGKHGRPADDHRGGVPRRARAVAVGYDPIDNPERSRARFAQVVDQLVDPGEITEDEADA